ncbi:M1 family metallopeptidase [Acidobacteriota bacterium]
MATVKPKHYTLHLEPDLETFVLKGRAEIVLEASEGIDEVILHAVDLAIQECTVRLDNNYEKVEWTQPDKTLHSLTLKIPRKVEGEFHLRVDYTGEINNNMLGFYRSKYTDRDGQEKYIAVTQFEEEEARKAFPCFDQPDMKATFDIEYVIDSNLTGLSNMPVEEEKPLADDKKLVRFERTPVMSTYLLFFGVGDFEILEDPGEVLLRAITTPGKINLAKEGLAFGRKCVDFFEEHFGTKYPLPKLDFIAVPDFAFGAMENWGAMTFRENLLLVYPGITSRTAMKRLFTVIAHEIVHMWFGDLVSPAHWKYLWLNESFATLYGEFVVDQVYPDWATMDTFLLETTAGAMGRDSLQKTFPVELGEEARITASTAPIIYDKGGSVMRMAIAYLGDSVKAALKDYFDRHAYSTAVSSDLWEAFSRVATDEPIVEMMKSWVKQPGFPLLEVKREGSTVNIRQKRFTYLNDQEYKEEWIIPLSMQIFDDAGNEKVTRHLLSSCEGNLELGEGVRAFKLNHEQTGFFRVKYDKPEWENLGELARNKSLAGIDRYGIQEDLFALVKSGDVALSFYLEFIEKYYEAEDHHLSLRGIIKNCALLNIVLEEGNKGQVDKFGKAFTERALERIGYEPKAGEELAVASLRSSALWSSALFGSRRAINFSREQFVHMVRTGEKIHPDIADAVQRVAAFTDRDALNELTKRFEATESEQERMTIATALGCVLEENMQEALNFALEKMPPALKFIPPYVMSGNPALAPHLWDMFTENQERLEKFHPMHFERILIGIISVGGLSQEKRIKEFFMTYAPESQKSYQTHLRESMDMALEMLEVNLKLRKSAV